jgi:hypothetical protein
MSRMQQKGSKLRTYNFLSCTVDLRCIIQGENLYEIWEKINALSLRPFRKVEIVNIEKCSQTLNVPDEVSNEKNRP